MKPRSLTCGLWKSCVASLETMVLCFLSADFVNGVFGDWISPYERVDLQDINVSNAVTEALGKGFATSCYYATKRHFRPGSPEG